MLNTIGQGKRVQEGTAQGGDGHVVNRAKSHRFKGNGRERRASLCTTRRKKQKNVAARSGRRFTVDPSLSIK